MKVALISHTFNGDHGGSRSVKEYGCALQRRGHEVCVFTARAGLEAEGIVVREFRVDTLKSAAGLESFSRQVVEAARTDDFDILHANMIMAHCDICQPRGGTLARTLKQRRLLDNSSLARMRQMIKGVTDRQRRSRLMRERVFFRQHRDMHFAAISKFVAHQLREEYNVPTDHIHVVFNGVEVPEFDVKVKQMHRTSIRERYGIAPEETVAVFAANHFREKGLGLLVDALARLVRRGRPLHVIVVGPDSPARYRKGKTQSFLHFVGDQPACWPYFHAADLCILPTIYDACSRVILEALACGIPAITTCVNGASEIIDHGKNGYILQRLDDPGELVDGIELVASLRSARTSTDLAVAQRDFISIERHTDQMLQLYHSLFGARYSRV